MGATAELARFVSHLEYKQLPEELIDFAKYLVLDQFGSQLACSTLPWSKAVYKHVEDNSCGGPSTVLNYGLKTSPGYAALANATFGHGFEIDDTDIKGQQHPGASVITAAFAVGEKESISGKAMILAMAAGYDAASRVSTAVRPSRRWFHPTGAVAPFGSAAATSKLLKLDEETTRNALSIASSSSGGTSEYGESGGNSKRLHAGTGCRGGLEAAYMARNGLTGPVAAIEGKKGFAQAFSDVFYPEEITTGLGQDFRLLSTAIKLYCCCGGNHAAIDATLYLRKKHGIKPEQVEEIIIGTNDLLTRLLAGPVEPRDIAAAQFCGRFNVPMALVKGSAQFTDYTEKNIRDPLILGLGKRTKLQVYDAMEKVFPNSLGARVTIKLKDGRVLEHAVQDAKGTAPNPVTREEIVEKFRGLAQVALPVEKVERLQEAVLRLDRLEDVRALSPLLVSTS